MIEELIDELVAKGIINKIPRYNKVAERNYKIVTKKTRERYIEAYKRGCEKCKQKAK